MMGEHLVCPRCGARDSFIEGYLPETCVCRVCQSQLDWREIPGCGPDCRASTHESKAGPAPPADVPDQPAPESQASRTPGE
jgi:rubredoxin